MTMFFQDFIFLKNAFYTSEDKTDKSNFYESFYRMDCHIHIHQVTKNNNFKLSHRIILCFRIFLMGSNERVTGTGTTLHSTLLRKFYLIDVMNCE